MTKNSGGNITYLVTLKSYTMLKTATLATTVALATFAFADAAEAALITLNGTD